MSIGFVCFYMIMDESTLNIKFYALCSIIIASYLLIFVRVV